MSSYVKSRTLATSSPNSLHHKKVSFDALGFYVIPNGRYLSSLTMIGIKNSLGIKGTLYYETSQGEHFKLKPRVVVREHFEVRKAAAFNFVLS
jgi:hypothetical protein